MTGLLAHDTNCMRVITRIKMAAMIETSASSHRPRGDSPAVALPTRFREAEHRGRRLGRTLRTVARVDRVDEDLMQRLGEGFLQCDELGARLAQAMRRAGGDPDRVSRASLDHALRGETLTGGRPAPALAELLDEVSADPDWLDRDLLDRGAQVFHRFGRNAADVLLQLALVGGYRFGGPTDLLVATGGLTGEMTRRRLGETQKWAATLSRPGALRPYGDAWQLTLHVRVMHALVNDTFVRQGRWDVARWGLPINQTDQAATLGLFDGVALLGVRALGVPVSPADSDAVMHLWRYVGWLLGVDQDFLVARESERHRLNYHLLLAQADLTDAGPRLAQAIAEVQPHLFDGPFAALRGRYEQERLLSMLTVFLGPTSMRELGLPLRPPWAFATAIAQNTVRYRLLGRTDAGRARLDRWGDRVIDDTMRRYFGQEPPAVAPLAP